MTNAEKQRGLLAALLVAIFENDKGEPKTIDVGAVDNALSTLCAAAERRGILASGELHRTIRSRRSIPLTTTLTGGWCKPITLNTYEFWVENFTKYAPLRVARLYDELGDRRPAAETVVKDAYLFYLTLQQSQNGGRV